jgi:hypothetical protein
MDSDCPVITIAGVAAVGKKTIAARLLSLAEGHEITFPCPWTLDTKYYTANVQIRAVSVSHDVPCSAQLAGSEALLLVFDVTDEQSVQSLQRCIQDFNGDLPEVCLMLANRVDLLAAPQISSREQSWHEQAQDWCCQNCFEYIEVSDIWAQCVRACILCVQMYCLPSHLYAFAGQRSEPRSRCIFVP